MKIQDIFPLAQHLALVFIAEAEQSGKRYEYCSPPPDFLFEMPVTASMEYGADRLLDSATRWYRNTEELFGSL